MGKNLKSLAKKLLDEEAVGEKPGRPLDEEYDPLGSAIRGPRSLFRGPNGMVIDQETRAIDELLSGIPKAQGFYLKLLKEIRPGEFEYKIRIDNWEGWTDLQEEIARIVRGYTEKNKFNQRWGSGTYQILISKSNGVRDIAGKYKPIYLAIDAMEPDQQYPAPNQNGGMAGASTADQLEMLSKLLEVVQKMNPNSQNQSLTETIANLKVDLAKTDSTNNTTMMQTAVNTLSQMLTAQMSKPPEPKESMIKELAALIAVLAPTGVLDKMFKPVNGTDSLVSALKTAKEMGMIPDQKKEDLFDMLGKLKTAGFLPDLHQKKDSDPVERTLELMSKLKPLLSEGKPSSDPLWFKLVDSFAPHALKLGSEMLTLFRENSKRRFAQPGLQPNFAGPQPGLAAPQIGMVPNLAQRGVILPADRVSANDGSADNGLNDNGAVPFGPTGPSTGIFDDQDEALMRQQSEFIARRDAQFKSAEPRIPDSAPVRPVQPARPVQPIQSMQPIQSSEQSAQELMIMQIFQQMKTARDQNDPKYFTVLRELILQQAGDEMYDSIIAGDIPIMELFDKVRFIAGAWIDEPRTAQYFQSFLAWAKQQQQNEIVTYCSKCDEEIIYASMNDWNASNKKCQECSSSLSLIGNDNNNGNGNGNDNGRHLDTNNLVGLMETGEANIKLPGE